MSKPKSKPPNIVVAQTIDGETGEVIDNTPIAVIPDEFGGGVPVDGVKVLKHVTVPVLAWPDGATLMFLAIGKIFTGKEIKNSKMAPAEVMQIQGMNGSIRLLIVGKVLAGELVESYPKDSYVGKWFRATKIAPNAGRGKRYATYSLEEIANPR